MEYTFLSEITIDMLTCQPHFINVPVFNTPIHNPLYKV